MDAQTFLGNFATIADAPGGIQRLRELVLELAVRGRLVEQRRDDEPASAGLDAVRADKGDTLAGSIRGSGSVPRIPEPAEHDGNLPPGWEWARVDDTGDYVNGLAFKNSDWKSAGIPIIRIQNLTNPSVPFNYADGPFPEDRMAHDGDILVSWSATLNAFRWHRGDAVVNQHIFKVIPDHRVVTTDYLFHLLRYCIRAMAESEAAHGLVMKHINRGPFLSHVISLPPLTEQERIVAKVDELMGLCDDLEAHQERRHITTARFRRSALHALTEAETLEDLHHAWRRAAATWTPLTGGSDGLDDLRGAVLHLAVGGRLAAQDPADSPAAELIDRTVRERDEMVAKRLTRVVPDDPSYAQAGALPSGWTWAPLQDLVRFIDYRGRTPAKTKAGVPLVTAKNIRRGFISDTPREFIAERDFDTWMTRGLPRVGDVLFTTEAPMGNAALIRENRRFALAQRTITLAPYADFMGAFLELMLLSPWFKDQLERRATGMTATGIKAAKLRLIRVPVPPVAEQARIVMIADGLLRHCDELEASLEHEVQSAAAMSAGLVAGMAAS